MDVYLLWALCVVSQVEVSETDWSLAQRSPIDCDASLCVIKKPRKMRMLKPATEMWKIQPRWVVTPRKQTNNYIILILWRLTTDRWVATHR
jgi:hypothetical protein